MTSSYRRGRGVPLTMRGEEVPPDIRSSWGWGLLCLGGSVPKGTSPASMSFSATTCVSSGVLPGDVRLVVRPLRTCQLGALDLLKHHLAGYGQRQGQVAVITRVEDVWG